MPQVEVNGQKMYIPKEGMSAFTKDYPEANIHYEIGSDTISIPIKSSQAFLKDYPQAKTIGDNTSGVLRAPKQNFGIVPSIKMDQPEETTISKTKTSQPKAKQVPFQIPSLIQPEVITYPDKKTGAFTPELVAGVRGKQFPVQHDDPSVLDWFKDLGEGMAGSSMKLIGNTADLFDRLKPENLIREISLRSVDEKEGYKLAEATRKGSGSSPLKQGADYLLEKGNNLSENSSDYYGTVTGDDGKTRAKDFQDLWKEGNYKGAVGNILLEGGKSLPTSVAAFSPIGLGVIGVGSFNEKYDQVSKEGASIGATTVNAAGTAAFELLSEKIGAGLEKGFFKKVSKETAEKTIKALALNFIKAQPKEILTEAAEEGASQFAENVMDLSTGVVKSPDSVKGVFDKLFKDVFKNAVYGAGGGAMGGVTIGTSMTGANMAQVHEEVKNAKSNFSQSDTSMTALLSRSGFTSQEAEEIKQSILATELKDRDAVLSTVISSIPNAIDEAGEVNQDVLDVISNYVNSSDVLKQTSGKFDNQVQTEKERQDKESNDIIQAEKAQAERQLVDLSNKTTGTIQTVKLKDNSEIQIANGTPIFKEDGTFDAEKTGIITHNPKDENGNPVLNEDGTHKILVVDPNSIMSLVSETPVQEAKAEAGSQIDQAVISNQIDNFYPEDVEDYNTEDGIWRISVDPTTSSLTKQKIEVNENAKDEQGRPIVYEIDDPINITDEEYSQLSGKPIPTQGGETEPVISTEPIASTEPAPVQDNEMVQDGGSTTEPAPAYPTDKNGNVDFKAMTDQQIFSYTKETKGEDAAHSLIGRQITRLQAQIQDNTRATNKHNEETNKLLAKAKTMQDEVAIQAKQDAKEVSLKEEATNLNAKLVEAKSYLPVVETPVQTPKAETKPNTRPEILQLQKEEAEKVAKEQDQTILQPNLYEKQIRKIGSEIALDKPLRSDFESGVNGDIPFVKATELHTKNVDSAIANIKEDGILIDSQGDKYKVSVRSNGVHVVKLDKDGNETENVIYRKGERVNENAFNNGFSFEAKSQEAATKQANEEIKPTEPVISEAKTEIAKPKETQFQKRAKALGEYIDMKDYILRIIAGGQKIKWKGGLESEFRGSNAERLQRRNYIDETNGLTPTELAHQIWNDYGENGNNGEIPGVYNMSDGEILDEVHEVLRTVKSNSDALLQAEERRTIGTYDPAPEEAQIIDAFDDEMFAAVLGITNFTPEQLTTLNDFISGWSEYIQYEQNSINPGTTPTSENNSTESTAISTEGSRSEEVRPLGESEKQELLRNTKFIETGETRIDKDYDIEDAEYEQRKVYVPIFVNKWDYAENTDPDIEKFYTLDEALKDLNIKGDMSEVNAYYTPTKETSVELKEVWLDRDGNEVEESDKNISYYDWAYENKNNQFVKEFGTEGSIEIKTFDGRESTARELESKVYFDLNKSIIKEYNGLKIKSNQSGKYRTIAVENSKGEEIGSIKLRIADHSYNPRNNDIDSQSGNFISIEIANKNETEGRFNGSYGIQFDGENTFSEVVESVNKRIIEIIDGWNIKSTEEVSKEEQFNLTPAKDFEQFETNINWFLKNYGSREMAAIQVELYLNEKPEFGKKYIAKHGITTTDELKIYLGKLQAKLRAGKGNERKAVRSEIAKEKTERNVDEVIKLALEAEAEMQEAIRQSDLKGNSTEQKSTKLLDTLTGGEYSKSKGKEQVKFQTIREENKRIDEQYFNAIERGDMETAQRIVDQQAANNGYISSDDYRDAHSAPVAQVDKADFRDLDKIRAEVQENSSDTNLYALANGISNQPDDYFSPQGARWYGYNDAEGYQSASAIKSAIRNIKSQLSEFGEVKDMPLVTVYRTVPKSLKEGTIRNGDWATPSLSYAQTHGKHRLGFGKYRIIKQDIPADNLWWDGNDVNEWGVDDGNGYVYKETKNNKKLTDVIVHDDNGEIIPPSKRFNQRVYDPRFHTGSAMKQSTPEEVSQLTEILLSKVLAKEVKMVTPEEMTAVLEGNEQLHAVYHGSPHSFDQFSLDHIGTGEGAQAFGYGLYFTDKKAIAEGYAKNLGNKNLSLEYKGSRVEQGTPLYMAFEILNEVKGRTIKQAIKRVEELKEYVDEENVEMLKKWNDAIEFLRWSNKSDFKQVPSKNLYSVELHEGKQPGEYDYLRWEKPVTSEVKEKIFKQLRDENVRLHDMGSIKKFWDGESSDFESGDNMYGLLSNLLGSQKEASEFLLRAGIDGIQYPANFTTGKANETDFNYVVFDPSAITIKEKVQFMRKPDGTIYGFVKDGVVYLNSEKPNLNTPIHEFGHLFTPIIKSEHPEFYQKGVELIKESPYYDQVKNDPNYSNLDEDGIIDEAMNQAIGDKGEKVVEKGLFERLKEWINGVWERIGAKFGIKNLTSEQIEKLTLNDWTDVVNSELLNGKKLDNSKNSIFAEKTLKEKQLDIINESNPMLDDYHTGIRSVADIKTLEEAISDPEWDYDEYNPDYTKSMAQKAIETGKVTVYSSNPIKQGVFVSPSKMEAESYSGNGKVYAKEVNTSDVAWIEPTQGQYAEVKEKQLPTTIDVDGIQRPTTNSTGKPIHSTEEGVRNFWKWFKDSKIIDESGRPLVVYHGTNAEFNVFDPSNGNPVLGGGMYFSNSKNISDKFAGTKGNIFEVYLKIENPNYGTFNGNGADMQNSEYRDGGIFTKNNTDKYANKGDKEYIVFSPTQIKSATGNDGSFSENNANFVEEKQIAYDNEQEAIQKTIDFVSSERPTRIPLDNSRGYAEIHKRSVIEGFKESGYVDFIGRKINSIDDVVDMWNIHRSPYIEKSHIIFVKDGSIVGTTATTLNKVGITAFGKVEDIETLYNKFGADGMYLLHNHPSGNHNPSSEDIQTTQKIKDLLPEVNLIGHIVIDHDKYSYIDPTKDGYKEFEQKNAPAKLFYERELVGKNPQKRLFEISKALLNGEGLKGAIIYLSPKLDINAYDVFPEGATQETISELTKQGLKNNLGQVAIITHDGTFDKDWKVPANVVDVIDTKTGYSTYFENEKPDVITSDDVLKLWEPTTNYPKPQPPVFTSADTILDQARKMRDHEEALQRWQERQIVNLATQNGERLSPATISKLNKDINSVTSKLWEGWADAALPIKEFQKFLEKNGVPISDNDNYYMRLTTVPSRIEYRFNQFKEETMKPFIATLKAIVKNGFTYDDITTYAKLKHGPEYTANILVRNYTEKIEAKRAKIEDVTGSKDWTTKNQKLDQKLIDFKSTIFDYIEQQGIDYAGRDSIEKRIGETADSFITNFESENGSLVDEFWKQSKEVSHYALDEEVRGGMKTKEWADGIKGMFDYYIPFKGHRDPTAETTWNYSMEHGDFFFSAVKKGKGRTSESDDPFSVMESTVRSMIGAAEQNLQLQSIRRLALKDTTGSMTVSKTWFVKVGEDENGNPEFKVADEVPFEDTDTNETYNEKVAKFEEKMKDLKSKGEAYQGGSERLKLGLWIKPTNEREHEVVVKSNGESYTIRFHTSPRVPQAINGTNMRFYEGTFGAVLDGLGWATRHMAGFKTLWRPAFILVTNPLRDIHAGLNLAFIDEGAKFTANTVLNFRHAQAALLRRSLNKHDLSNKYDKMLNDFMVLGGKTGISKIMELKEIQKSIEKQMKSGKDPIGGVFDFYHAVSDITENQMRFAIYITAIEKGYSSLKATSMAKEATVNFDRKGNGRNGLRELKATYAFINVGFQALDNIYSKSTKNTETKKRALLAIAANVLSGSLLVAAINTAMCALFGWDEDKWLEDFSKRSSFARNANFTIWTPEKLIDIPLGQEFRMYHGLGMDLMMMAHGKVSVMETSMNMIKGLSSQLPYNPIESSLQGSWASAMPDFASPLAELAANKSWLGYGIYKQNQDEAAPGYTKIKTNKKGEPYAPEVMIKLSKWLNESTGGDAAEAGWFGFVNPDIADHLLGGYFAGIYEQPLTLLEATLSDKEGSLIKELTPRAVLKNTADIQSRDTGLNEKYYKAKDEAEKVDKLIGRAEKAIELLDKKSPDYEAQKEKYQSKIDRLKTDELYNIQGTQKTISALEKSLDEISPEEQVKTEKEISELKKNIVKINNGEKVDPKNYTEYISEYYGTVKKIEEYKAKRVLGGEKDAELEKISGKLYASPGKMKSIHSVINLLEKDTKKNPSNREKNEAQIITLIKKL